MSTPCLVVLTARGPQTILDETGTQAWRLKPDNVMKLKFCVCVQNRHNGHWGGADQEHHHAFMVGRIKEVVPSPERPVRFLVVFSEYARIDSPNGWPGLRNPVRYGNLEEFGVTDPADLDWKAMPTVATSKGAKATASSNEDEDEDGFGPLTIAEAKAGLALGLGVPESAIEISIRF
jgi:hypothetical protein